MKIAPECPRQQPTSTGNKSSTFNHCHVVAIVVTIVVAIVVTIVVAIEVKIVVAIVVTIVFAIEVTIVVAIVVTIVFAKVSCGMCPALEITVYPESIRMGENCSWPVLNGI